MNRSLTSRTNGSSCGEITRPPPSDGNQRCYHIWIFCPSPTLHRAPLRTPSRACRILLQAKEHRGDTSASKILPEGKYLAWKTLKTKEFLTWKSRHTCFPNIPPTDFEEQSVSYLTQWIFLEFSEHPHQNFRIMASISLRRPMGSLKTLMEYVGMDWITAWITV